MVALLEPRNLLANPIIDVAYGSGPIHMSTYHDSSQSVPESSLVTGYDPDETMIHLVRGDTNPVYGTVTIENGYITYSPTPGYVGTDTFGLKYVDQDDESSDEVIMTVSVSNSGPQLMSLIDWNHPLIAGFGGYHDSTISADSSYLLVVDNESDAPILEIVTDVSEGTLDFNTSTGAFTYTPNPLYAGPDYFTFTARDGFIDGESAQTITVLLNVGNTPPEFPTEPCFDSPGGDVVRVSIADLLDLSAATDVDEPLIPASFEIEDQGGMQIRRIGDELIIIPPQPSLSDDAQDYIFTFSLTDSVGEAGTGSATVRVAPVSLRDAWLAVINREEARHFGYRYYAALGLANAYSMLRSTASDNAVTFQFGSTGTANATYSPFYNTVTVDENASSLNASTVIHETIHIVDDWNGWYLSDNGVTSQVGNAERLAWAGEQFLLASSNPISGLRSFEDAVFNGSQPGMAAITSRWEWVIRDWAQMPSLTYTSWTGTWAIGVSGWTDFLSKFGMGNLGLGLVAMIYAQEISSWLGPMSLPDNYTTAPPNPPVTYTVPPELW